MVSTLELWDNIARKGLHLLGFIEDRVQEQMPRAGANQIAKLVDALLPAPPYRYARSQVRRAIADAEPVS